MAGASSLTPASFTSRSACAQHGKAFSSRFDRALTPVQRHGNVLAANAFLHCRAVEDLDAGQLAPVDPGYEVVITARAMR